MTWMFEVYYKGPVDSAREARINEVVAAFGGHLDCHEPSDLGPVVLTFEFSSLEAAKTAADELRTAGEHVEGPEPYGD